MPFLTMLLAASFMAQASALIEGTVVKMGTGEPIAGAAVSLDFDGPVNDAYPLMVTTGPDGKFVLSNVATGTYRLIAKRNGGYVPAEYGQRSATGQGIPLSVNAGQRITGIQLVMAPTAAISGRIYDRDGEPLGRAQVQALRAIYRNGRRRMTIVQSVETNDRGEYRLFWLAPGEYYVSARPDIPMRPTSPLPNAPANSAVRITAPARFGTFEQLSRPVVRKRTLSNGEFIEETHIPVYYPGVVEAQAASGINVPAGATVGGVDIAVGPGIIASHHIRGRAFNSADGQPLAQAAITAIPRTFEPDLRAPAGTTDPNGFFDISGAVPAAYLLVASNLKVSGIVPIEVANTDLESVTVVAGSGFKVSGRFIIEAGTRSGPKMDDLRIARLIRDPGVPGMPSAGPSFSPPPEVDGSFVLEGVSPGDLRVTVRGVPEYAYVKSMRMGNVDVLDSGLRLTSPPENRLEIVINTNAAAVHGSVLNARQEAAANRVVVVVPDVRLRHRSDLYKSVSTDGSGRFHIMGLTPGDYKLFAFDVVEDRAWEDPDFIRNYEDRGKTIHVDEGSDDEIPLAVIP